MYHLLRHNNVLLDAMTQNESCLKGRDKVYNNPFQPIYNNFVKDFANREGDMLELVHILRVSSFRYQAQVSFVYLNYVARITP